LQRGFSQNRQGKDPIGFSRTAKAKRKLSKVFGLEARAENDRLHDLKVVAI
jgi:hypothetical protein